MEEEGEEEEEDDDDDDEKPRKKSRIGEEIVSFHGQEDDEEEEDEQKREENEDMEAETEPEEDRIPRGSKCSGKGKERKKHKNHYSCFIQKCNAIRVDRFFRYPNSKNSAEAQVKACQACLTEIRATKPDPRKCFLCRGLNNEDEHLNNKEKKRYCENCVAMCNNQIKIWQRYYKKTQAMPFINGRTESVPADETQTHEPDLPPTYAFVEMPSMTNHMQIPLKSQQSPDVDTFESLDESLRDWKANIKKEYETMQSVQKALKKLKEEAASATREMYNAQNQVIKCQSEYADLHGDNQKLHGEIKRLRKELEISQEEKRQAVELMKEKSLKLSQLELLVQENHETMEAMQVLMSKIRIQSPKK